MPFLQTTGLDRATGVRLPDPLPAKDPCSKGHVCVHWCVHVFCFCGCKCLCLYACACAQEYVYIVYMWVNSWVYVCKKAVVCVYTCVYVCGGVSSHLWVHLYRVHLWICFFVTRIGERNAGTVTPAAELATASPHPAPRKALSSFPSASGMLQWKPRFFLSENWRLRLPGAGDSEWLLMGTEFLCEVIRCSNII